jgi:hypothetical protein
VRTYVRDRPRLCPYPLPPRDRVAVALARRAHRPGDEPRPLEDALGLLPLYASGEDPKFERAAARWLARLALEKPELGIVEMQFAAAALAALPAWEETAIAVLVDLSR